MRVLGKKIPVIRVLLLVAYISVGIVSVKYEQAAKEILDCADHYSAQETGSLAAVLGYQVVIERYPLSSSVLAARMGYFSNPLHENRTRLQMTFLEHISPDLDPFQVDLLPLIGWTLGVLVLLFVSLTRVWRRPGTGLFAFVLALVAGLGLGVVLNAQGFLKMEIVESLTAGLFQMGFDFSWLCKGTWGVLCLAALLSLTPMTVSRTKMIGPDKQRRSTRMRHEQKLTRSTGGVA